MSLQYEINYLVIQIKDNGVGIADGNPQNTNQKGSGLINMKNHATMIGADLTIHSESSKGTEIVLTVPDPYK
ncbi:MAG: hypothetical protein HC867_01935 [Bacteroidia bacterium]|nr:hypothetical protein [Bacteroidia bacterium]